jgi:ComF family protein
MHFLLRALIELLAGAVAPNRCAACDADVPLMTAFCKACAGTLVPLSEGCLAADRRAKVERAKRDLAAFVYGGAIAQTILRMKFEKRPDLARPLAAGLCRTARLLGADRPDLVVPVPLHPRRLVERGYNQAALLAAPVAKTLQAEFLPGALQRSRETEPQKSLDRDARSKNLEGAFAAGRSKAVRDRRVLLVDDVRTTGATLSACSAVLLEAGAREVHTLVVAQAVARTEEARTTSVPAIAERR